MIKIKGLERLSTSIKKKLEGATKNKELLEDIGKLVATQAKGFTRTGKLMHDESVIDSLKESTIESRERMAKHNKTGSFYKGAAGSNLTFSGQLIDSIKPRIEDGKVIISPQGDRIPYKNKDGSNAKKTPTNQELAGYLKDQRPFLQVGNKTRKSIVTKVKSFLRRFLRD